MRVSQVRIGGQNIHERGEVAFDDAPKDVEVHGIVPMDEAIPQTHDLRPRNGRMTGASLRRNPRRGLADDLEKPDKS